MAVGKHFEAEKILIDFEKKDPHDVVEQTYALESDPRLISDKYRINQQAAIAFVILINILKTKKAFTIPAKKRDEPAADKELDPTDQDTAQPLSESALPKSGPPPGSPPPPKDTPPKSEPPPGSPPPKEEIPLPDYYATLGVSQNASQQEIRAAYRNLMKEYHPDVLRSQGLTPEEMAVVTRKAQDINIAYALLLNEKSRQTYDSVYHPPSDQPLTSQVAINFTPSKKVKHSTGEKIFSQDAFDAGIIDFSFSERATIKQWLPKGFNPAQLTTALNLFTQGVTSKGLEKAVDESSAVKKLNEEQAKSLYAIPYLIAVFEDFDPQRSINFQQAEQVVTISEVLTATQSSTSQVVFNTEGNLLSPVIKNLVGKGVSVTKGKMKDFSLKALKKSGNKLAKQALKKGAGLAIKAGVKTGAAEVIGGAIGTAIPIPIVGTAIGAAIGWIAEKTIGLVVKGISKIAGFITGEKDKQKQLAIMASLGAAGFLFLGMPIPAVFLALTAFAAASIYIKTAIVGVSVTTFISSVVIGIGGVITSAVGVPILLAAIIMPIIIALLLFIINSGAYIVPRYISDTSIYESSYIRVQKAARDTSGSSEPSSSLNFDNSGPNITIEYTITITALKGSLSNISFNWTCEVFREAGGTCPVYGDVIMDGELQPTGTNLNTLTPPEIISATEPYVITYIMGFQRSLFTDSLTMDTFTVTADVEGEVTGEQSTGTAAIIIGQPPTKCFTVPDPNSFPGNSYSKLLTAINILSSDPRYTQYTAKACMGGPISICFKPTTCGPWGCHHSSRHSSGDLNQCDISLTTGGLQSAPNALYILAHETAHHLQWVNGGYFTQYMDSGAFQSNETPLCSYSETIWAEEAFAEGIALYVSLPSGWCGGSYSVRYPLHYNFVDDVIF